MSGTNPASNSEFTHVLQTEKGTDLSAVIETAQAGTDPAVLDPNDILSVVMPRGASFKVVDLESKLESPRRKRGSYLFWEAESIAQFVNTHKTEGTTILLDDREPALTAVLNGHSKDLPGWEDFVATLGFRRTPAWMRWLGLNEQFVEQETFAEHIERNLVDIVSPSGADMLELAQTFEATNSAEFRSQRRLANGQRQFQYSENIDGKGGANGQLEIPDNILLQIAPFEGGEEYKVTARFRFRLNAGMLKLSFVLDSPDDIERQAVGDVAKQVESLTSLPVLFGTGERWIPPDC